MRIARNLEAEHRLLTIAAAAAGYPESGGKMHPAVASLERFAASRAHPGPILMPPDRSLLVEASEEIADAGPNYMLWAAVMSEPGLARGEHDAAVTYDRAMRALVRQIQSWVELHTIPR